MRRELYQQRRAIAEESKRFPEHLVLVPESEWRPKVANAIARGMTPPLEVWRSRRYLVQVFAAKPPAVERLTMQFTAPEADGWREGLTWEVMQRLKAECGRGDRTAVEVFPADRDVVNIANLRHVWVLADVPDFVWTKAE